MSDRVCCHCGEGGDLRPYGPNGANVCFPCATGSPDRLKETEAEMGKQLDAAEAVSSVVVIGEEAGPRPIGGKRS